MKIPKITSKNKIVIKPYIPTSFSKLHTTSPLKPVLRKKENPSFSLSLSLLSAKTISNTQTPF